MSNRQIQVKDILAAEDKDAIVRLLVEKEINDLAYKRSSDWFAYLEGRAKLGCPAIDEIDRLAEAKASRDILIQNRGIVGKIYLSKAGKLARFMEGETIDIPLPYHLQTWQLLRKVATDISDAAIAKLPPTP